MGELDTDLEDLYRRRQGAFQVMLASVTGSVESARDVVQEAFAQALRDEARAITVALDDAGIERSGGGRLQYKIEAPGSDPGEVNVWLEPYLPHGEIVCTVCG